METAVINHQPLGWVEYAWVASQAAHGGWLGELQAAHAIPCDEQVATEVFKLAISVLPRNPRPLFEPVLLQWGRRVQRGHASYHGMSHYYRVTLPTQPGARAKRLRVGLVLHEVAHVLTGMTWRYTGQKRPKRFHGPEFCASFRRLLALDWRQIVNRMTASKSFSQIYDRHRGPYSLSYTYQSTEKKVLLASQVVNATFRKGKEAHDAALDLLAKRPDVTHVFAYSDTEQQFIGAVYRRGETYEWTDDGRVELPAEREEAALLHIGVNASEPESLPGVDAPEPSSVPAEPVSGGGVLPEVPKAPRQPRAPRKPGVLLAIGDGPWPPSRPAQAVREWFDNRQASAAETVAALGDHLQALGVAHPGSLISRLKQSGALKEVTS